MTARAQVLARHWPDPGPAWLHGQAPLDPEKIFPGAGSALADRRPPTIEWYSSATNELEKAYAERREDMVDLVQLLHYAFGRFPKFPIPALEVRMSNVAGMVMRDVESPAHLWFASRAHALSIEGSFEWAMAASERAHALSDAGFWQVAAGIVATTRSVVEDGTLDKETKALAAAVLEGQGAWIPFRQIQRDVRRNRRKARTAPNDQFRKWNRSASESIERIRAAANDGSQAYAWLHNAEQLEVLKALYAKTPGGVGGNELWAPFRRAQELYARCDELSWRLQWMLIELEVYRDSRRFDAFCDAATRFIDDFNRQPGFPNARRRLLAEVAEAEKLAKRKSWPNLSLPDIVAQREWVRGQVDA
ncbi:MAG: hypothetical protein H0U59_10590 [Gemmatimonadaceae bacterium]|nr:hypothetical protein [Gemmatimonadaceae bacterium]